jgi:hypothetical protein
MEKYGVLGTLHLTTTEMCIKIRVQPYILDNLFQIIVYQNAIHAVLFPNIPSASQGMAETASPAIQQDVTILLGSPDNKFSDEIGIGSHCILLNRL